MDPGGAWYSCCEETPDPGKRYSQLEPAPSISCQVLRLLRNSWQMSDRDKGPHSAWLLILCAVTLPEGTTASPGLWDLFSQEWEHPASLGD